MSGGVPNFMPDRRTTRPFGTQVEHAVPHHVDVELAGPTWVRVDPYESYELRIDVTEELL